MINFLLENILEKLTEVSKKVLSKIAATKHSATVWFRLENLLYSGHSS